MKMFGFKRAKGSDAELSRQYVRQGLAVGHETCPSIAKALRTRPNQKVESVLTMAQALHCLGPRRLRMARRTTGLLIRTWSIVLFGLLSWMFCLTAHAGPSVLHVKWDATGLADGSSWANAYTNLQTALKAAGGGTQIWISAGTYIPGIKRVDTFLVKTGVELYGGFSGTETNLDERLWQSHVTILSGDINQDDTGVGGRSENAYQVVNGAEGALLDGFTISGGNADSGTTSLSRGGGMYNSFFSVTLRNCTFTGNTAATDGGAVYVAGNPLVTATTVIENCRFVNNSSDSDGGAISLEYSSSLIRDCLFTNNYSSNHGGAMFCLRSSLDMANCVFAKNSTAYGRSGAVLTSPMPHQEWRIARSSTTKATTVPGWPRIATASSTVVRSLVVSSSATRLRIAEEDCTAGMASSLPRIVSLRETEPLTKHRRVAACIDRTPCRAQRG
jgi:predicted outer membrane repeat protein